jgi:hypothetical protein
MNGCLNMKPYDHCFLHKSSGIHSGNFALFSRYVDRQILAFHWRMAHDAPQVFTSVTYKMSKSGSPTLPWAIPCYHCMQHALCSNIEDSNLSVDIYSAASGLACLDYYYSKARANHSNVIATSTHFNLMHVQLHNLHLANV